MNPKHQPDNWGPCPSGTLEQLGSDLRNRRRHRHLAQGAMAAALMAVLVVAAMPFLGFLPSTQLTCDQVRPHLANYVADRVEPSLKEQIAAHLRDCPECHARHQAMQQQGTVRRDLKPLLAAATSLHVRHAGRALLQVTTVAARD